ncbi:MAG: AfsR/SARP family transcriptional regulator [Gemmatimonadaceae bacterium]
MPTPESTPSLRLLGGAVIQAGDTPLGGPAAHRHRLALLALLAVSSRPMSRDKLVAYLWPERDTERARNLLKTALHELRKLLGEGVIRSVGDQLDLDPALVHCDVWEFEAAIAANDLVRAASFYAGPFLDGFFIKEAQELDEWVEAQRRRLAEAHAGVLERLGGVAPTVDTRPNRVSVETRSLDRPRRRWPTAIASILILGVAATLLGSSRRDSTPGPVILPDDDAGTALLFNGTGQASTTIGTLITPKVDNVAFDARVRFDSLTGRYQMLVYNGHGAVTGWGVMVVGRGDGQPEGTIAILAGGITITATPLVLKKGTWQYLSAERRDGKVTVFLDDQSYVIGPFPVNPVIARYRAIERTSVGGDGTYDAPKAQFRGAIDRLRIRDLAGNYWVDRWNFDEGRGPLTIGARGGVLYVGGTQWTPSGRLEPQDVFWSRLESLCGQSFAGRVADASLADSAFRDSTLLLNVRSCNPTEIRIAFHVGTDRSRVWVLRRTAGGLRLKHAIHRADGTPDAITQFGGDTRDAGSLARQDFFADARTASLIPSARTNVWTLELAPNELIVYEIRRPGTNRRFRVEFGMPRQVASPLPPWGSAP